MSGSGGFPARNAPRLLKAAFLTDQEGLLKETRGTALYYFPGPIFALLIVGVLDLATASVRYGWATVPGLSGALGWAQDHLTSSAPSYLLTFFLIVTLLVVLWLLYRYLKWISTVYAVTTHRVLIQGGIISRDLDEIPVSQVRGVDVHQSGWQRLLGYGTVRVSSEGGAQHLGNEDWRGIPRPFEFQRLIQAANQALGQHTTGP